MLFKKIAFAKDGGYNLSLIYSPAGPNAKQEI